MNSTYAATDETHDEARWAEVRRGRQRTGRGIEVGHIFYFGDKYSAAMGLKVSGPRRQPVDADDGQLRHRRLAARRRDHRGEPRRRGHRLAGGGRAVAASASSTCAPTTRPSTRPPTRSYARLSGAGVETLYDDRDERGGAKFATMDLIGLPWQLIVGPRGLAAGMVELKRRAPASARNSLESALARLTA